MIKLDKNAYCLSCNINRFHHLQKWFHSVGLQPPVLFPGVILNNGPQACLLGHISIVMMARCLNLPYYIVYEDDAYPRPDVIDKFNIALQELNETDPNWGMFIIGRSGETSCWDSNIDAFWSLYKTDKERNSLPSKAKFIGNHLLSIPKNSNGSHSYIVRNWCYNEWLRSLINNNYSDIAMGQTNFKINRVYWTKELLFCQKQIDNKCMTNLGNYQGDSLYIYPYNYNVNYMGVATITKIPPNGFVEDLLLVNNLST